MKVLGKVHTTLLMGGRIIFRHENSAAASTRNAQGSFVAYAESCRLWCTSFFEGLQGVA